MPVRTARSSNSRLLTAGRFFPGGARMPRLRQFHPRRRVGQRTRRHVHSRNPRSRRGTVEQDALRRACRRCETRGRRAAPGAARARASAKRAPNSVPPAAGAASTRRCHAAGLPSRAMSSSAFGYVDRRHRGRRHQVGSANGCSLSTASRWRPRTISLRYESSTSLAASATFSSLDAVR